MTKLKYEWQNVNNNWNNSNNNYNDNKNHDIENKNIDNCATFIKLELLIFQESDNAQVFLEINEIKGFI